MLDFIAKSGLNRLASCRIFSDCVNEARGSRTVESNLGTHSTLWAKTLSGNSSSKSASASRFPSRSEQSNSSPTSGHLSCTALIQLR